MPQDFKLIQFAGIHLAGVNSHRSAVCILNGNPLKKPIKITGLYEKIGHFGNLFSDDRLLDILRLEGPFSRVFVDAPLSVPPCVACTRSYCPGVDACEDEDLAYMMSLANKISTKQKRRRKSLNPQVQRLWDIYRLSRSDDEKYEATYSSNNAHHAVRARGLQKRLTQGTAAVLLEETSVAMSLEKMTCVLGLDTFALATYRSFSEGKRTRELFIQALIEHKWLDADGEHDLVEQSVDVFEAFVTALVASLAECGLCERSPPDYSNQSQWVFRPELSTRL
ncbi:hypothetical protein N9D31_02335 [Oligoflexaceae bacterium]|nr:hypothetical protein [Oligoflexaceae bacterium]